MSRQAGLKPWVRAVLAISAILVALVTWALSSAVGSSPDEDYHLTSIWCGQGLREGVCEDSTSDLLRRVPVSIDRTNCYAFKSEKSADCQDDEITHPSGRLVATPRGDFIGDYPPVFYWVLSTLVGPNVAVSVVAMRIVSATIVLLLASGIAALVPTGARRALILALTVTAVPFGMFLAASINPSGWAVFAAALLMVATVGFLRAVERWRALALGGAAALALLLGAGARADSSMYAIIALFAALAVAGSFARDQWPRLLFVGGLGLVAAWAYLSSGQSSAASATTEEPFSLLRVSRVVLEIPSLWAGNFGSWKLGWLDTQMPAIVWVVGMGIFSACTFLALSRIGRRQTLAVLVVALAAWLVPSYIQYLAEAPVGTMIQARYVLPLLVLLAATAMVRTTGAALWLSSFQRWVVVGGLSITNAVALHANIRRYVTGEDAMSLNLNKQIEWWWDIPVSPLGVWAVGAVALGVGLYLVTAELVLPRPAGFSPSARSDVDVEQAAQRQPAPLARDAVG